MSRPNLVIAHYDGIELFSPADLTALSEVADVLDARPLGRWDDPRADDLLSPGRSCACSPTPPAR